MTLYTNQVDSLIFVSIHYLAHINMTFDTAEDVAGFASAVFKGNKDKVYKVEPNFLNPRKNDELFHDYSANCTIM